MHRVIDIDLEGQPRPFRLHEDAYEALGRYLDEARAAGVDGADTAEVVSDLERSIGSKLADRMGATERVLSLPDVEAVLAAVGPVAADRPEPRPAAAPNRTPNRRRLYRIREDQWIAGVCQGIATYADVGVDWVRTIFVLLTVVTAGVFLVVYLVLAFVLPILGTKAEWYQAMDELNRSAAA